jgi:hypothetical protein
MNIAIWLALTKPVKQNREETLNCSDGISPIVCLNRIHALRLWRIGTKLFLKVAFIGTTGGGGPLEYRSVAEDSSIC